MGCVDFWRLCLRTLSRPAAMRLAQPGDYRFQSPPGKSARCCGPAGIASRLARLPRSQVIGTGRTSFTSPLQACLAACLPASALRRLSAPFLRRSPLRLAALRARRAPCMRLSLAARLAARCFTVRWAMAIAGPGLTPTGFRSAPRNCFRKLCACSASAPPKRCGRFLPAAETTGAPVAVSREARFSTAPALSRLRL